jgi:putative chitinase
MKQAEIINSFLSSLKAVGITNPILQAGLTGILKKESGFEPKTESSYKNTSNERLRRIFTHRLKNISDKDLSTIKTDDLKFFNLIYGGTNGNNLFEDSFKYRGRGLNQLTFKSAYQAYGKEIGEDIINYPDKVNEPITAVKIAALFFKNGLEAGLKSGSFKKIGVTAPQDINTLDKALLVGYQINAGLGTNINTPFFTDSIAKAKETIKEIYADYVQNKQPINIGLLIFFFSVWYLIKKNNYFRN